MIAMYDNIALVPERCSKTFEDIGENQNLYIYIML